MRRQLNNVISVVSSAVRISVYSILRRSDFRSSLIQRISPNVVMEINKGGKVKFGSRIRIHSGCKVKVRSGAELVIGNNVKINYYCIIACQDKITIGEGTEFGPSVYVYDHDHDYMKGFSANSDEECYKKGEIRIGKNCWIGANTVILRGSKIGDNVVIGAGSIVKGEVPAGSRLIQERTNKIIGIEK